MFKPVLRLSTMVCGAEYSSSSVLMSYYTVQYFTVSKGRKRKHRMSEILILLKPQKDKENFPAVSPAFSFHVHCIRDKYLIVFSVCQTMKHSFVQHCASLQSANEVEYFRGYKHCLILIGTAEP